MDLDNLNHIQNAQFIERKKLRFEVHLTDHCNLNCFGCFHFSPLASEWFLSLDDYRKDCQRLSELSDGFIEKIELLGGEPLLHPEISNVCIITRNAFPIGNINILTNALLIKKMDELFWEALRANNIGIVITRYPLNLDYNEIKSFIENHGICIEFRGDTNEKTQTKIPLDLNGKQNIQDTFHRCHRPNRCIQLRDGKLWTCVIPPYIKYFNNYFGKNFEICEDDYIDIYKVNSIQKIYKFLVKPIPFCRYCKNEQTVRGINWSRSKKNIIEWL